MERDILRRTHNIFSSLKDETGNKYDDRDTNISFVDENTLKYQNVIKKMDGKKGSEEGSEEEGGFKEQSTIITTNIKHIGKGIVVQSYGISDDEDEDEDEDEDNDSIERDSKTTENKVMVTYNETFQNPNKKIVYTVDKNIDVDDI